LKRALRYETPRRLHFPQFQASPALSCSPP
jgi:hypothetical protein